MALLLETTLGDLVIDLDVGGSPTLCNNVLKLCKARYYTSTLVYNIQSHRFCQCGDPVGDGTGGTCIYGLLDTMTNDTDNDDDDVTKSKLRFLQSRGRVLSSEECRQRGVVVATEMNGIPNTIGSQFLITIDDGPGNALDGYIPPTTIQQQRHETSTSTSTVATAETSTIRRPKFLSLGKVVEDYDNVLGRIQNTYCDATGRPYGDIRIHRALVVYDPFPDPSPTNQFQQLLEHRGIVFQQVQRRNKNDNDNDNTDNDDHDTTEDMVIISSPSYERPPEEIVEKRISIKQLQQDDGDGDDDDDDDERTKQQQEEIARKEDKSRAVVLEMLGDLPSADIRAPDNVLFVCKLNSITQDEDLELIFSRFDPNVRVEIIRDHETGASLGYAFCEFTTKDQCVQAYFKMNGALVDDRRIKVDFSQSVAKVWDRYHQRLRPQRLEEARYQQQPPPPGGGTGRGRGRGGRGRGRRDGHNNYGRGGGGGGAAYQQEDRGGWHNSRSRRTGHHYHEQDTDDDRRGVDRYRNDRDLSRGDERGNDDRYEEYTSRRSDYDDFGRKRRSRSPSPDVERNRDDRRRKHSSRKRHRRERSRSHNDDDDDRDRHGGYRHGGGRSPRRRHDSDDDGGHHSNSLEEGDNDHRRQEKEDDDRRRHLDDANDDERRHRKKHHRRHRDKDDRHRREHDRRHKKRKHKEKRRRSRSRSRS